jgi:hypothetical protein
MSTSADLQRRAQLAWDLWERLVGTDTESWTEDKREQHLIDIDKAFNQAVELDKMAARADGRRIFFPVVPINR